MPLLPSCVGGGTTRLSQPEPFKKDHNHTPLLHDLAAVLRGPDLLASNMNISLKPYMGCSRNYEFVLVDDDINITAPTI